MAKGSTITCNSREEMVKVACLLNVEGHGFDVAEGRDGQWIITFNGGF